MTAYKSQDERNIRVGRLVEDWTRSGLLTAQQREGLMPQVAVGLRRTNLFLRVTLFLFGGLILQSGLGLVAIFIGALRNQTVAAVLCLLAGGGCFWLAAQLVSRYNLYRFGVEEAVALGAVGLAAAGAAILIADQGNWPIIAGLAVAAAMLALVYCRFGYVYAAVLAMAAAAALPFQFGGSEFIQRVTAMILLAAIAVAFRFKRIEYGADYPGDDFAVIEAAAWLGIYLLLNLLASTGFTHINREATVYWVTYAGMWMLPAAGLWVALRGRERPLLVVSIVMALATLLSNKEYLGSPRYEWDPIVFGLLLMGVAIAVRRWLASGDGGMRHGYTASRLLASDKGKLGALAMVSATQAEVPVSDAPPPAAEPPVGGGGRAGGAGAGGSF